eukprot:s1582_g17.t1
MQRSIACPSCPSSHRLCQRLCPSLWGLLSKGPPSPFLSPGDFAWPFRMIFGCFFVENSTLKIFFKNMLEVLEGFLTRNHAEKTVELTILENS